MTAQTPGRAAYEAFARTFPTEDWGPWDRLLSEPLTDEVHPHAGWETIAQAAIAAAAPGQDYDHAAEIARLRSALTDIKDAYPHGTLAHDTAHAALDQTAAEPRPALAAAREHIAWIWRNTPDETVRDKADQALHQLTAGGVTAPGREPGEAP